MRMWMPPADAHLLMSATGDGLRWNNYLARRLRPQICATAVRWAVGERKRLVAYIIEDATLIKIPAEGITQIHVRFKGGRTKTLTTRNPKTSAQQIKTRPEVVQLVDQLLDQHVYSEIAAILNERGFRPGASARPGRAADRFSAKRVQDHDSHR